eukprot:4044975-Amphidinium_carterae.1
MMLELARERSISDVIWVSASTHDITQRRSLDVTRAFVVLLGFNKHAVRNAARCAIHDGMG